MKFGHFKVSELVCFHYQIQLWTDKSKKNLILSLNDVPIPGKNDPARKYFTKATALDKLFGPAWLAYGHSFAADGEHDQAMAAYFKAHQIMKG